MQKQKQYAPLAELKQTEVCLCVFELSAGTKFYLFLFSYFLVVIVFFRILVFYRAQIVLGWLATIQLTPRKNAERKSNIEINSQKYEWKKANSVTNRKTAM